MYVPTATEMNGFLIMTKMDIFLQRNVNVEKEK